MIAGMDMFLFGRNITDCVFSKHNNRKEKLKSNLVGLQDIRKSDGSTISANKIIFKLHVNLNLLPLSVL